MKIFLKGFCISLLCLSLLGLLWFLVLQPGLTNGEAQALKEAYSQPLPGAESSGELPAGKEQPEPESLVDLSALQEEYPDIKGWISIPGTCVDYPVLQSSADDPEHYLRRTYKGEHRTAGSIFFQWDCTPESKNLVVYGHNMNDGTMFAVLQKMANEAFRNEHSKILLQTSDGLREYRIAAVLKTDIQKLSFHRTVFADDADFLSFQEELFSQSIYEPETIPGADCRLLTLVTCSYEWENARTVVVAAEVR
jgi:sortase B